jgi:large subunit ribosomal protein L32
MPLPKRRHSHTRGKKRRTHWKLTAPNLSECPQCHSLRMPHRACPSCGFYRDREVVTPKSS